MSRATIRIVIILAAISISGIVITQIYWVKKALDLRGNQFTRDVSTALDHVASQVYKINGSLPPEHNPVEQIATNYFVVSMNGSISPQVLEYLLISEFAQQKITVDFEYGIYDCVEKCMIGEQYVSTGKKLVRFPALLPEHHSDGYYFGVQFPQLQASLISQMGIWGFSSAVLLIVVCFFVYTMLVILKQRRLSEIQKDFINNMTHEFKTPLSTISISTQVLMNPDIIHSPERLLNYATIIETENQRLRQQVDRVLRLARVEHEGVSLQLERVNLNDILQETASTFSLALNQKEGWLKLSLPPSPSWFQGDRLHLTNAFYNLIDNAIQYADKSPEVHIECKTDRRHIQIVFHDRGIGIRKEDHNKVFQRFYRASTGNRHDVKGFGLGLSYVKMIVKAHQGRIALDSEPGKGSTFTITLPKP